MIFDKLFKKTKLETSEKARSNESTDPEVTKAIFQTELREALRDFMDNGSTTYPIARLWETEETIESAFYSLINKYMKLKRSGLSGPDGVRDLKNLYACFEAVAKSMPADKGKFDTYYTQFCCKQQNANFGNFGGELLYNLSKAGRI